METTQPPISAQPTIIPQPKPKLVWIFLGVFLICAALTGSYFIGKRSNSSQQNYGGVSPTVIPTAPPQTVPASSQQTSQLDTINIVNMAALPLANRPDAEFFGYQIKYPSKYVVTTDEMITSYNSQGGQAPPRMILTVGKQPLGSSSSTDGSVDYSKVLNGQQDCVAIWTTLSFSSLNDWRNNVSTGQKVQVLNSKEEKHGKYAFFVEDVMIGSVKKTEALLKLPQNVTYYIHTCNMNNKSDLQFILDNLAVKGS